MNRIKVSVRFLPGGIGARSPMDSREHTKNMTVKLTLEELRLLTTLTSDQLFRRQFIDPKMPGFTPNPAEMDLGKALLARLSVMVDGDVPKKARFTNG